MNRYENGKIYKIVDVGYRMTYIGSTCEPLCNRFAKHKQKYTEYINNKADRDRRVNRIFDEFGVKNCKIELIEYFPCHTREELLKQEGKHIRENDCVNKIVSGRTQKEYQDEHREHILEKKKEYYYENHDYIRYQRKILDDLNREKVNERAKGYYQKRKDRLSEKIMCGCGKDYTYGHKARHEKSERHKQYLQTLEQQTEQ